MANTKPVSLVWGNIQRHPGWSILALLLAFILWGFPVGFLQSWPSLVHDKTLPEWLAERGWPSLTLLTLGYLTFAFLLTLIVILGIIWRAYRGGDEIRARLGELLTRGRTLYEEEINNGWPRDVAIQLVGWADEVEEVLKQWKGDDSYVELFRPQRANERVLDIDSFPEATVEAIAAYGEAHSFSSYDLINGLENHLRSLNSPLRPQLRLFMNERLSSLRDFILEIR